jgi:pyruvate dehydrogenase E2 component (dihydrolipoamide acetyltransferase)
MAEFRMPSLGADMEAGTLVEWQVKPGDPVKRGDIVAVVETDKGIVEVEIFEEGVVGQLLVPAGQRVPVGTPLAIIVGEGEALPAAAPVPVVPELLAHAVAGNGKAVVAPGPVPAGGEATKAPPGEKRPRISPLARRVAAELGVDLDTVQGTGPHGAIEKADVERAAAMKKAAPAPPPPPKAAAPLPPAAAAPRPVPPAAPAPPAIPVAPTPPPPPAAAAPAGPVDFQTAMRRAIAAAMSRANREIPHYYLETRIDMTRPQRWLEAENLKRSMKERLLPVVLLIKATALALVDVPELNGYWVDERQQVSEAIHIGFAISLRQGGLVTPAIHHADQKSLDELMENLRDLITRTRAGRLRSSELTDATITLTSLGDQGVEKVFGVIYPPQLALVGFGKVVEQPWAENSMVGVRPVLVATLAGDHRATDGHRGGQFLDALTKHLQEPEKL